MEMYSAVTPYLLTSVTLFLSYQIIKTVYRLTLHPLAKFPGPKIVAISRWYEAYYELIEGGRFYKKIEKMHQQYGPIVRVTPSELHIDDLEFYDRIFNFGSQFDKREFQMENLQHTPSFELHKLRRQAMGPFFSRQSVLKLEWLIKESIERLCGHLQKVKAINQAMDMSLLYRSMTSDIVSEYAFSKSYGFLDDLESSKTFFDNFAKAWRMMYIIREIPVISLILLRLGKLPKWLVPDNSTAKVFENWEFRVKQQINYVMKGEWENADKGHPTIFGEIKRSKLPASDKTADSIYKNASMLLTAGFETTGFCLSVAHYHILANPSISQKLKSELAPAFAEVGENNVPPWTTLEKLPYLHAVIQEALRMSVGVMSRLQRKNMKEDMKYGEWIIPRGTPVGMSQSMTHYNRNIFPDPWKFEPERWLKGEESKALEKYLVSFSRGARECVAKQLAKAEIYLTLATVFHRFDMELFETTRADVDPKRDYFVPATEGKSEGYGYWSNKVNSRSYQH